MPYQIIRHKVEDYAKWKPVFDEHRTTREAHGLKGERLFRNASSPNEIVALFEWEDAEKMSQFTGSQDLREAMQRTGVLGPPDIVVLDEVR